MSGLRVAVVDYESGNLRSVARALEVAGVQPEVTSDPATLMQADAAVLPGVGAGDAAMAALLRRGLDGPIVEFVASGRPFLGVCLGLQLLMDSTDEGDTRCLGIVHGRTRKLPEGLKVPHMGWNRVAFKATHPMLEDLPPDPYFYFVHSYYVQPKDESMVASVTEYGIPFCSVVVKDNLVATQFHPEKSGSLGLKIYENFVRYAGLAAAKR